MVADSVMAAVSVMAVMVLDSPYVDCILHWVSMDGILFQSGRKDGVMPYIASYW